MTTIERPATRPEVGAYRDDLIRSVPFRTVRAVDTGEGVDDGLSIEGYGAVFNSPTRIASWEGEFDETIAPGAFRKSIRENTPVMQYDHGRHPLIGSIPLGRWDTVEEDTAGLHVAGRLSDNWLIEPVRDAIRGPDGQGGGVTGMSFRFSIVREEWTDAAGKKIKDEELTDLLWYGAGERGPLLRTLKEVKVSEVGPVAWPAYDATSVGVRSVAPFVVDLGAVDVRTAAGRKRIAQVAFLADSAAPRALDPREREETTWQAATRAGREGGDVAAAIDAAIEAARRPEGVDTLDGSATIRTSGDDQSPREPQATAGTAETHPTGPPTTDAAAGTHSPSARDDRAAVRAAIRARMLKINRSER